MMLRPMAPTDEAGVFGAYKAGIDGGDATFQTSPPPDWAAWFASRDGRGRLVAEEGGRILGFVAFSPVSARDCYRGVLEVSVYVAPEAQGRGVGRALLAAGLKEIESGGAWFATASIFPENAASLRLHQSCGFKLLGRRERIAFHEHPARLRWRDTLILDWRSAL